MFPVCVLLAYLKRENATIPHTLIPEKGSNLRKYGKRKQPDAKILEAKQNKQCSEHECTAPHGVSDIDKNDAENDDDDDDDLPSIVFEVQNKKENKEHGKISEQKDKSAKKIVTDTVMLDHNNVCGLIKWK